jgi:2-phospho-L-lactate guanylyltransferase
MTRWTVIIPVKPAAIGKSRLGLGPEVARGIALDTIAAVLRCDAVDRVIVVTSDRAFRPPGAEVLLESAPTGIDAAVAAGAALAGIDVPRAALLGDLPTLVPGELSAALSLAAGSIRSFVADHEGTGTTLVAATPGVELVTAFGTDSAARHRAMGLEELELPAASSVRLDVDTPEQFARALRRREESPPARVPRPRSRR